MNRGAGSSSEATETGAAYRDDLAYIHDAGFGGLAREAGQVLVDALRRRGITEGLVIDLGCGSGILSGVVTAAGHQALGIDISEGMVAILARACAMREVPGGVTLIHRVTPLRGCGGSG